jgi:hypothetical protein
MEIARLTVRPRTSDKVQSNFLGCSEEWLIGEHSFGREVTWSSFEWRPIDVLYDYQLGHKLFQQCHPPLLRSMALETWPTVWKMGAES